MRRTILPLFLAAVAATANPAHAESSLVTGVAYKSGDELTPYERSRCRLDIYTTTGAQPAPVVVYFHGGGLTGGDRSTAAAIAELLVPNGIMVVAADYRLSPRAEYPAYIDDARAAVVWTHENIAAHGGDPGRVFISGHSAGGYLTMMAASACGCFAEEGAPPEWIAGLAPIAGQMLTHTTVRRERGQPRVAIVADQGSPLYAARVAGPPVLLIAGDRDLPLRAEENQLMFAHLRNLGDKRSQLLIAEDRDHGTVYDRCAEPGDPVGTAIVEFIRRHAE